MKIVKELRSKFSEVFGSEVGARDFFAPGRVNLIGEHTDYNGGYVFPCALSFGTYAIARKIEAKKVRVFSTNFEGLGVIEFDLEGLVYDKAQDWANYPKGVVKVFQDAGYVIDGGFEILFFGNIPNGAGLSSSASIELATCVVLKGLFNLDLDMVSMVKLSQKAENQFIGVNCGIMDQFAIGKGKEGKAILLDCNTLDYRYADIKLDGASIVIANTNKRRGLADSKYNERRGECTRALEDLQKTLNIKALGELTVAQFEENKHLIVNDIDRVRAKHAVYENERTKLAVKVLEEGNIERFGKLMNESHISLRDDYEVTGIELDTLVALAWEHEGVIGSRMTGAGFGGCTVSIVKDENVSSFIKNVGEQYAAKIGYAAEFYVASIGEGARELV